MEDRMMRQMRFHIYRHIENKYHIQIRFSEMCKETFKNYQLTKVQITSYRVNNQVWSWGIVVKDIVVSEDYRKNNYMMCIKGKINTKQDHICKRSDKSQQELNRRMPPIYYKIS